MAEPLKHLLSPALVAQAGTQLRRAWRGFEHPRFEALALDGLEALPLKARALQICAALQATLPADFDRACGILEASLAPAREPGATPAGGTAGLAGWIVWPMTEYVAQAGLDQPARALAALHAMTQRFTAEWAVRPFILRHPGHSFATLQAWARDPSAHVRRLASEGSRPRLPWGLQLRPLIADPTPTLPLLEALQDDASDYVRRSVANHLNDIAKDHPGLVADWLARHLPDAPPERRVLLRHASRSLLKQGHPATLAAWGLGTPLRGTARLQLAPEVVVLGGQVAMQAMLASSSRRPQLLVVDYAVHHIKAHGGSSAKVFKGWTLTLAPGEERVLRKTHAVKPITTRRYHGGLHRVELLVNGRAVAEAAFALSLA
jgi:3-methyladenine DNA glycosylase AlkC